MFVNVSKKENRKHWQMKNNSNILLVIYQNSIIHILYILHIWYILCILEMHLYVSSICAMYMNIKAQVNAFEDLEHVCCFEDTRSTCSLLVRLQDAAGVRWFVSSKTPNMFIDADRQTQGQRTNRFYGYIYIYKYKIYRMHNIYKIHKI